MKITEHEMRGLLTGRCVPGDVKVNEELPAYLVRKLAVLQEVIDQHNAECDRLILEKAALQEKVQKLVAEVSECRRFVAEELGPEAEIAFRGLSTERADAVIREIKAQGVEILTGKLQLLIDDGTFDAKEIGVAAGTVHTGAQIASQLRAGDVS